MPKWFIITLISIGSILLLLVAASVIGKALFEQNANKKASRLFAGVSIISGEKIRQEDLAGMPQPVQRWLTNAHVVGTEKIITVRLKQTGIMRTKANGPWMPFQAVQYYRVDKPGFVWEANVKMAPFLHLSGLDHYYDGKGSMNIKLQSLFPVVAANGKEIDQATLLRFLAEMGWFPQAALNSYLKWESIDAKSARATMTYKGVSASGVFTFNEKGDITRFDAKRYKEVNGRYTLSDWEGVNKTFKEVKGIRIPVKSEIIWKESTGDFNWFQCEIVDVEYNQVGLYE